MDILSSPPPSGPRAAGAVPGAAVRGRGGPGGLLQDGLPPPQVPRRDVLLQSWRRQQWQERIMMNGFTLFYNLINGVVLSRISLAIQIIIDKAIPGVR